MRSAWIVVATERALECLRPLIDARQEHFTVETVVVPDRWTFSTRSWAAKLRDAASVLVVGPRRRSPRTFLPGLFLRDSDYQPVPMGWLPDVPSRLGTYAAAAARVAERATRPGFPRGPAIVMGQWEDRFLRVSRRAVYGLRRASQELTSFQWTSDRIVRRDLLKGLRCGVGLAIYFGHGRSRGWAGYHGIRPRHLTHAADEPNGAILSIACDVASRHRVGLSFAEELALHGICGAALGAVRPTMHIYNSMLGRRLCKAFANHPIATLCDLLLATDLPERSPRDYRVVGDPLTPLLGARDSVQAAGAVYAPSPDEPLAPWAES